MKKMTKRRLQAIRTKNKILETALPMVREKGFNNVSVDEICSAAGIAKGTFYHHFERKEGIFGDTGIMMNDEEVDNLLNDKQMSTYEKICILMNSYVQLAEDQGLDITRAIMRSFLEGSGIYHEGTLGREVLRCVVEEGATRHEFKSNLDNEQVIDLVQAFSAGLIVFWCSNDGNYDLVEKANSLTKQWLRVTLFK